MSQFSFPVLEDHELLPCLGEMEVQLDSQQMLKPTYDVVRSVFEHLVIMLTGYSREELTQPAFTAMDAFEWPELHDESIPSNNFLRQVSKLMLACGVKDFSWRDIFKPETIRLRRHLSAVVNFAKFREEKALVFQELQDQLDTLIQETRDVEEEHARHTAELKKIQAERATQLAEVSNVEAEDSEVVAKNNKLNKEQAALQGEVRALKTQANTLADQASQAKLDLSALKTETEQLQDQIVQSPDKHRQAIADLATAAEEKRAYYATLSSTSIENDRKLEMVAKFDKEVGRCMKLLEELDSAVAKKKDVSQQVKDVRESINSNERALAEIVNTGTTLKRHQLTVTEKFQRLEQQAALKMEAAVSCVEEQLKTKEAMDAENAALDAKAAEDEAMIRSIRERISEMKSLHESQVTGVLDKYNILRRMVGDYNRQIEAAIEADC